MSRIAAPNSPLLREMLGMANDSVDRLMAAAAYLMQSMDLLETDIST